MTGSCAGRRSKLSLLSDADKARFLAVLRAGSPQSVACRMISVSYETLRNWRARAAAAPPQEPYASFIKEVERVEALCHVEMVVRLNAIARGVRLDGSRMPSDQRPDWRAIAWWLMRRFPKQWGDYRRVELRMAAGESDERLSPREAAESVRIALRGVEAE